MPKTQKTQARTGPIKHEDRNPHMSKIKLQQICSGQQEQLVGLNKRRYAQLGLRK